MTQPTTAWFAGLWRWHFYASLIVIPIFVMLSVTGLTWLFRYEIQQALYPGIVSGFPASPRHPLDHQLHAVQDAYPEGKILSVMEPWDGRATMFVVETDGKQQVFVDPSTAAVTGALKADEQIYDLAIQWHGDLTAGSAGDALIELAACWALFMALSGYVLFFLRLRPGNQGPKQRLRNAHGWVGVVIGVGILFQLVSGLPWTGIWGNQVQNLASGQGLSLWGEDPGAESKLATHLEAASGESAPAPWALGESEVPQSGHHHGEEASGDHRATLSLDLIKAKAEAAGLPGPYLMVLPTTPTGVYSVLADQWMVKGNPAFSDVTQERVIHYDQYSGDELARYGYEQYSPVAKLVSQSIAIHEGRRFGLANLLWSTFFCLGILFLCVTGPVLWWRRRNRGSGMGAPKVVLHLAEHRWILVLLAVLGVLLPLFGLSLLVLAILDRWILPRVPQLARFFNKPS